MPKDNAPEFTVKDKRKYTMDGDVRPDVPEEAPVEEASAPVVQSAPPAPKEVPQAAPVVEQEVALPKAEDLPETGYDADAMRTAFGGHKIEFIHLLDMLIQTAMMYAGAMENGPDRRVDIIGLRQMIDMISVLEEKTKGNLTDQEKAVMSNTLFQLRMTYMEIVSMIEKQAQQGPGAPGGPKK